MALDKVFAAAYIDNGTKHRVLGVRLRPFCLWHMLLLQAIDSPFLKKGTILPFDLRVAAGICRLRYRQSKVHRPIWPILTRDQLAKHSAAFFEYVGDYLNKPDWKILNPPVEGPSRPWPHPSPPPDIIDTVFRTAIGSNCTIREAWEMPIGEAYISEAMYWKDKGEMVDFMNDEERDFQSQMKAYLQKRGLA